MERPSKIDFGKINFRKNVATILFLEAVNQLKNISDCIKIDPPGPGQNLRKKQSKQMT